MWGVWIVRPLRNPLIALYGGEHGAGPRASKNTAPGCGKKLRSRDKAVLAELDKVTADTCCCALLPQRLPRRCHIQSLEVAATGQGARLSTNPSTGGYVPPLPL